MVAAAPQLESSTIWQHVYQINMYFAGEITQDVIETVFRVHRQVMKDCKPASTMVGVHSLAFGSLFEVSVVCAVPEF